MPSPKSKRKQAVKAKLMFVSDVYGDGEVMHPSRISPKDVAVYTIPADRYEEMVEQVSKAGMDARAKRLRLDYSTWDKTPECFRENIRNDLQFALRAIGIKPLTPTKGSRV